MEGIVVGIAVKNVESGNEDLNSEFLIYEM